MTLLISLLVGCSWTTKEVVTKPTKIEKPELIILPPEPIVMNDVKWVVVTPETSKSIFDDLTNKNKDATIFGLDDGGYEALSINISNMIKYITEQKSIIQKYKEYYSEEKVE